MFVRRSWRPPRSCTSRCSTRSSTAEPLSRSTRAVFANRHRRPTRPLRSSSATGCSEAPGFRRGPTRTGPRHSQRAWRRGMVSPPPPGSASSPFVAATRGRRSRSRNGSAARGRSRRAADGRGPNEQRHSVVMTVDDAAIERLVVEARDGDPWAFGLIFDHYHDAVYRFIASRVHRPSDAEDLTQHVFVKALEALPRYEARGVPFGGWLFRLARNAVIDHVRTRHDHAELDSVLGWSHGDAGPDEIAVVRQELDAVGVSLASLTPEQREAIALRFFAGLSARETAEAMGKQEGTVRGLQFRAIAALRRQLGIDGPEPDAQALRPARPVGQTDG